MRVVVSLTTISSRVSTISAVINSLLAQEVKSPVDSVSIYLYISRTPYLLDHGITSIPDELQMLLDRKSNDHYPITFEILECPNTGPHRKYCHALSLLSDDDVFITVDDDTLYPPQFLERMVTAMQRYNCVVAMRGRRIAVKEHKVLPYRSWHKNSSQLTAPSLLNVGTGKDGIAYRKSYLDERVLDIVNALEYAATADDLWLKVHTLLNGIPTVILSADLNHAFPEVASPSEARRPTLFGQYNNINNGNDLAMVAIDKYLMSHCFDSWCNLLRGIDW